jgi:hypothetical protein
MGKRRAWRASAIAEAHIELRDKVEAAMLDLLSEKPMGVNRLTEEVLARVPDATREDVAICRTVMRGKTGQIEMRANKLTLSGIDRTKPITGVERQVVACLDDGRTPRQVADACDLVRTAFSARTILAALEQRGIVRRLPDQEPATCTVAEARLGASA